jgi:hypothetical protein
MKAVLSAALSALTLAACVYVPSEYRAGPVHGDPKKIVERVMYEQPESKRPEYVDVTDDYVEFGAGSKGSSRETLTGFSHSSKKDVTRVYYRTMVEAKLLDRASLKGHWYIVEPRTAQGRKLADVYVDDRKDAENFIDALMALRTAASATE